MYIAIEQFNPTVGALRENSKRALARIDALASVPYPPDLVVFPAFALTGAPVAGLQSHDAFSAECLDVLNDFCARAKLPTLVGTLFPQRHPDTSFINLPEVVYCEGGKGEILHFSNLFERMLDEQGASLPFLQIAGEKVTVLFDGLPESDEDFLETDVLVVMLAKDYHSTDEMFTASLQIESLSQSAVRNSIWIVCVNLVGGQDDLVFDGASIVIAPSGQVIASAQPFEEHSLLVNLAANSEEVKVRPLLPYEADWRALTLSIRDYLGKNGFSDCVIGLSGGIDSSVTAALACDALGAEHVHGVLMPSHNSSPGSISDATELAKNLGIATLHLPITGAYDGFVEQYQRELGSPGSDIALQNIQARIRTIHLMHLANSYDWLLLNTGNKSEAAMGYSTLYGDTAGALAPLGNTYKTDVYGLAEWRNQQSAVIPRTTLEKPPSAELYEGQKDSDALPDYQLLDRVLRLHIDRDLGADQIITLLRASGEDGDITPELVLEILGRVRRAEFKRRQEPLAPSLASVDITNERAWPVTNGFNDRNRNIPTAFEVFDFLGNLYGSHGPRGAGIMRN
ncbi:MAG: NAD(+) synthase [Coriobacteriales bacterium]|jgi:NAD+ synthetase|nr:NAD(+) synthase [Coriobacteriales bacterium]